MRPFPAFGSLGALSAACGALLLTVSACSGSSATADQGSDAFGPCGTSIEELRDAAMKEGALTLLASPREWGGYGELMDSFTQDSGIEISSIYPDATSGDELTLLRTWRNNPARPDVADLSPEAANVAANEGLLTPYESSNSDSIAAAFTSPDGSWQSSYVGVTSMGVETSSVSRPPTSWADLLLPEYRGMVTLNGDPRESGSAAGAVVAAALANGGSLDDVTAGIDYFARLQEAGNLNLTEYSTSNLLYGEVPIGLDWNFTFRGNEDALSERGLRYTVSQPTDGVIVAPYAQGISATAPHPCAARLWVEYLNSDEAVAIRSSVGVISTRLDALADDAGLSSDERRIVSGIQDGTIAIPTAEQWEAIRETIDAEWGPAIIDTRERAS